MFCVRDGQTFSLDIREIVCGVTIHTYWVVML